MQATLPVLVLRRKLILPLAGNDKEDCGGEWVIVRRHRESRKKFNKASFNKPGARSHPGEGLKHFGSPLGRAGPRPQSGASFSAFSTVSVSSPVASSLDGAVGPHAAAVSGAALFHEECRHDPEFRNRVLGLERMLRVKAALPGTETVPVSKVSGAVPGVSCAPPVRCFRGVRNLDKPEVTESELSATSLVGEDAFAKNVHVLDDGMDGACSALGVRNRTARASPVVEDTFANNVHVLDDCLKGAWSLSLILHCTSLVSPIH